MADKFSFDVVSELNMQEVANAIDQAKREIGTRYDFKDSAAGVELDQKEKALTLTAENEPQLEAVRRVVVEKFIKRNVEPKAMDPQKVEQATHKSVRQLVKLKSGIDKDTAKLITRQIKEMKLKVNAAIQGDAVRVSGAKKDELQAVIQALRSDPPNDTPLQFINFR